MTTGSRFKKYNVTESLTTRVSRVLDEELLLEPSSELERCRETEEPRETKTIP